MPNPTNLSKKHLAHLAVVKRQERIITISTILIVALVIGIVGYGVLINTVLMPYRDVATVNGDQITVKEFQSMVKIARFNAINSYSQYLQYAQMFGVTDPLNDANFGPMLQADKTKLTDTSAMGTAVIDQLIDARLIEQEAKKRNITVSDAELEKSLQGALNYFPGGTPTSAPTATEFLTPTLNPTELAIVTITPTASPAPTATEAPTATADPSFTPTAAPTIGPSPTLAPTETPQPTATAVDAAGYQKLMADQVKNLGTNVGMDEAAYRKLVLDNLLRTKLFDDVTKDMKPEEDQVWARHILVKTAADAANVEKRLKAGEDFAALAKELSIDTGTKDKGGDLGWFGKGAMLPAFETAAFALPVGQISDPVETTYGYHIIQVIGHEVRPISDSTFQQNKQTAFTAFLKQLRDASKVTINDFWKTIVPTEPAIPASLGIQ